MSLIIEIAKSILERPRKFSSDEFADLVEQMKINKYGASWALTKLERKGFIESVGSKSCGHARGKDYKVYCIIPGMEDDLSKMIANMRKSPVRKERSRVAEINHGYLALKPFDRIQSWLDGITRARLSA